MLFIIVTHGILNKYIDLIIQRKSFNLANFFLLKFISGASDEQAFRLFLVNLKPFRRMNLNFEQDNIEERTRLTYKSVTRACTRHPSNLKKSVVLCAVVIKRRRKIDAE